MEEEEKKPKIMIVEARFYPELSDMLVEGAEAVIREHKFEPHTVTVPGVLEIPLAIKHSVEGPYEAFVALGVVIRGETSHYDIVSNESARGLMDLGIRERLFIGNGIVTVENEAQARERCDPNRMNKGGAAAQAAYELLKFRHHFQKKT